MLSRMMPSGMGHLKRDKGLQSTCIDALVKRCDSDDLIFLSLIEAENVAFKNKRKLFDSLELLRERREWRHLGLLTEYIEAADSIESLGEDFYDYVVELNRRLRGVLSLTGVRQINGMKSVYCAHHHRRFVKHGMHDIAYAACPICNKPQYGVRRSHITAVLDTRSAWTTQEEANTLRVNWLNLDALFDFDAIEIGVCTPDAIDAFCVAAGNDPLLNAHKKLHSIPYRLLPGIQLQQNNQHNLNKLFRQATS